MTRDALPNFVIVGAPRCGTSAVFTYLAAHPRVAGSSVKEVQYFMDEDSALFHEEANYRRHGLTAYGAYFEDSLERKPDATIVFEATPGYMHQRTALEALPALPSDPRFLFQLRKPSEQVYSSYVYSLNQAANLSRRISFREFAFGSQGLAASESEFHRHALAFADYGTFLSRWADVCGEERMRVACFESLRVDPRAYMQDLARWLEIDPGFYDDYDFSVVNRNVAVRSRALQRIGRRSSVVLAGRARVLGRDLYRRMNTAAVSGPSNEDRAVMAEIDEQLNDANEALARRFGTGVSAWAR
jgi:hypothetical protein